MEGAGEVAGIVLLGWPAVHHEELEVDELRGEDLVGGHGQAEQRPHLLLQRRLGEGEEGGLVGGAEGGGCPGGVDLRQGNVTFVRRTMKQTWARVTRSGMSSPSIWPGRRRSLASSSSLSSTTSRMASLKFTSITVTMKNMIQGSWFTK